MPRYRTLDDVDIGGSRVLLRTDINAPIDRETGAIADDNRLVKSLPTIRDLSEAGARLVIVAHQGDTLDYHNLVSLRAHADRLADMLGREVGFIDDVAGPAARDAIRAVGEGEILLLDNLRYLTEEVSTFEQAVKLTPVEMTGTYLVRNLAPLFDLYVNDAFAAAHRNSPSMVAFQEVLPTVAGRLLADELDALSRVGSRPQRPCVFLLGGLKISDAFGMMTNVLAGGIADLVLTTGITGQVMLMAAGIGLGEPSERFIRDRSLDVFVPQARASLDRYPKRIRMPLDVAFLHGDERREANVEDLPVDGPIVDVGPRTVGAYRAEIERAGTVFVNGPAGVYETEAGEMGTRELWRSVAASPAVSVIGGGDTVASARRFIDLDSVTFVSTGGGALIRYLSGQPLPLLEAMERAAAREGAR